MEIHINMQSGGHFKITDPEQAEKFLTAYMKKEAAPIEVMVDGWLMILTRRFIEAVAIKDDEDRPGLRVVDDG